MTQEQILDIMEICPWRERRREGSCVCIRYIGTIIPCNGACSWVADHARLKQKE